MTGLDTDNDGIDEQSYIYNSDGVRVSQTDEDLVSTTVYHIDTMNPTGYAKQLEEYVDGQLTRSFGIGLLIHSQTDHVAGLSGPAGTTLYFAQDASGHTRGLLDSSGDIAHTADMDSVAQELSYDAFGELISIDSSQSLTNWQRSDGVLEPITGFTYHLDRWRNGSWFTQEDSYAGNAQSPVSLNKYLYASASPVMYSDPTGLFSMGEMLSSMSIQSIMNSIKTIGIAKAGKWAFNGVVTAIIGLDILQGLRDGAERSVTSVGFAGTIKLGSIGSFAGAIDFARGRKTGNIAVFAGAGYSTNSGATSLAGGIYIGAAFNTPTSQDYKGACRSVTIAGSLLSKDHRRFIQKQVQECLPRLHQGFITRGSEYANLISPQLVSKFSTAVTSAASKVLSYVVGENASITLWGGSSNSFGFSFAPSLLSRGSTSGIYTSTSSHE